MAWSRNQLACILSGCVLGAVAGATPAEAPGNPYQGIAQRNAFGLKPTPPPQPAAASTSRPSAKIILTGITTILGDKRAIMKTPARAGTPLEPARPDQFFILAERQRDGGLEVLEIDETAGTVKVDNSGLVVTLSFDENGVQPEALSSPPPPGPVGAVPIIPPPPPKPLRLGGSKTSPAHSLR